MSDNPKEAEKKMVKEISMCNDNWLKVFALLAPSQLGLQISLLSRRFDRLVDEHFKTRPWALGDMQIRRESWRQNGQMEIANSNGKSVPIADKALPRKVIGFERIFICYMDKNVKKFLRRFRCLFASRPINLSITAKSEHILKFIVRNIWPLVKDNICGLQFHYQSNNRRFLRHAPTFLSDCPSLRFFALQLGPTDVQMATNWLYITRPDGVPKVLKCEWYVEISSSIEAIKAAFASASSPVNFIICFCFPLLGFSPYSVVPSFDLTNELSRERLAFKRINNNQFLLIRSPIGRNENEWAEWEKEAIEWKFLNQRNKIDFVMNEDELVDGPISANPGSNDQQNLLDASPGPSDQQK